jgi:hypothetical protein
MSTMPDEKSRNELLSKLQEFSEAWAKSDTSLLDKLLAVEYKHTDIQGKIFNRKQWLEFASAPRIISDIKMDSIETLWYEKFAVVTGRISFKSGEQKQNIEMRGTQIWTSQEGSWKRVVFQGTLVNNQ